MNQVGTLSSSLGHHLLELGQWLHTSQLSWILILSENIYNYVFGWVINKTNFTFFNNLLDKMVANVNILGTYMVLVILYKCNC